jgi:hypothetical protein
MENAPASGLYLFPMGSDPGPGASAEQLAQAEAVAAERIRRGPLGLIVVRREGVPSLSAHMARGMASQLVMQVVAAALLAWLLGQMRGAPYGRRVLAAVAVAVFGGAVCHLPEWHWYHFPTGFIAVAIADLVIGWAIGGAIVARVIQRGDA